MRGLSGKRALFTSQKGGKDMYCTSNERYECCLSIDLSNLEKK